MAAAGLSPSQLRVQVDEIESLTGGEAPAIGMRTFARWDGPETLSHAERDHRVVHAPSVLEAREALAQVEATGVPVILLTPLESRQVGRDVL